MLPHDDDAARLARNAYHFGEFFVTFGISPPRLEGQLLWGRCHERATCVCEADASTLIAADGFSRKTLGAAAAAIASGPGRRRSG